MPPPNPLQRLEQPCTPLLQQRARFPFRNINMGLVGQPRETVAIPSFLIWFSFCSSFCLGFEYVCKYLYAPLYLVGDNAPILRGVGVFVALWRSGRENCGGVHQVNPAAHKR